MTTNGTKQCSAATAKANRILGQIKNSFSFKDKNTIVPLYKALVRPHLKYAESTWSPSFKSDLTKSLKGLREEQQKF